jgi:hypothetical protein
MSRKPSVAARVHVRTSVASLLSHDRYTRRSTEVLEIIPLEISRTEFGLPPSKYAGRFRKRRRPSLLLQNVVEAGEQMRNSFLGFVAHVGQAERLATNFAVTGVDDEMMFLAQFLCE